MTLLKTIIFFFTPFLVYTQQYNEKELRKNLNTTSDSLKINTYKALAEYYFDSIGNGDSTIFYGNKMIQLAKRDNDKTNEVLGYSLLGKGYTKNKDFETAKLYFKEGLILAQKYENKSGMADLYSKLGGVYQNLDDIPQSVSHFLDAIKFAKESKDFNTLALSYYGLSIIYSHQDQEEKQLQYLRKAIRLADYNPNIPPMSKCLVYGSASQQFSSIGSNPEKSIYKDSSLVYAKKSLAISKSSDLKQRIPSDLITISVYHINNKDLEKSITYMEQALPYVSFAREDTRLNIYQILSYLHRAKGEKEKSYAYLDTLNSLPLKKRAHYGAIISKFSHTSYKYFKDYELAFKSLDEYFNFEKEKKEIEQNKTINELETKYQTELKETKIKRLTFFIIVLIVVLLASILLFIFSKLKKAQNKNQALKEAINQQLILEKELINVRNNIAQDFHDDLGNKLARISFLTRLVEDELSDSDVHLKSKVTQVKEDTISLYVGTKDFIFSLKPNSDYLEEVVTYLSDFGEDYFSDTKIEFRIDKSLNLNKKLPSYWSKQLIFIFKEAMTNAFKHSECDKLSLNFHQNANSLIISCDDNGKGISQEALQSQNGLLNMKKRAEKIGCELEVITNTSGSTIRFIGIFNPEA